MPGAAAKAVAESENTNTRSEEHTSELQSRLHLVCRLLLEKKKKKFQAHTSARHLTIARTSPYLLRPPPVIVPTPHASTFIDVPHSRRFSHVYVYIVSLTQALIQQHETTTDREMNQIVISQHNTHNQPQNKSL